MSVRSVTISPLLNSALTCWGSRGLAGRGSGGGIGRSGLWLLSRSGTSGTGSLGLGAGRPGRLLALEDGLDFVHGVEC